MDGNNGKAIASMTIKQSYVDACVCVCAYGDLLKRPLVVLCVLPQPPRPTWQTSRPLKHIRSCCSSDNLSLGRTRSTWIWAVSVSVPHPRPHWPSVPVSRRSTLHLPPTLSVAILRFPSRPLDSLCLHLSLHKMDKMSFHFSPSSPIRGLLINR